MSPPQSLQLYSDVLHHQHGQKWSQQWFQLPRRCSAKKLGTHIATYLSSIFKQVDFFPFSPLHSVGAANEDTDSQSYGGEWLSRVLIKGSAGRGAINQTRDHSYSCSADRGCYVVFIQLLARCRGTETPLPAPVLPRPSDGGARGKAGEGWESNPLRCYTANLSLQSCVWKITAKKLSRNLVSVPGAQNKQCACGAYNK